MCTIMNTTFYFLQLVISLIYYSSEEVAHVIGVNSPSVIAAFDYAKKYISLIQFSVQDEINSFIDALNGRYIAPSPAGDVLDVNSLPTGGNFFHDQSQELPTKEAYEYALSALEEAKKHPLQLSSEEAERLEKIAGFGL